MADPRRGGRFVYYITGGGVVCYVQRMSSLVIPDDLSTVTYAVRNHVARVTLNRPEVHNAFNAAYAG